MRNNGKGLGFGVFLLTAGVIWLLSMAHIVTWSTLNAVFTLWPLVLVALGIGFIFRNNGIIRTVTWLVLVAVVIGYGYYKPSSEPWFKYDLTFDGKTNYTNMTKVTLQKQPQNEKAELVLDYGAMQVNIDSETSGLLDATVDGAAVNHSEDLSGKTASLRFERKKDHSFNLNSVDKLRNDFHLSKDVIWNLKLDTGAMDGDIDISGLKVEKLEVDSGATNLSLDMGSCNTTVKIDSGATKLNISLPEDTGLKVRLDSGLNSSNLKSGGWRQDGDWYYSPDYDSKAYKSEVVVDSGLGSITVD